jgi:virginiamycin B lyase
MTLRYLGAALILFLSGCSANHTANPTSVLPGASSLTSPAGVEPFGLSRKNIIHTYPLPQAASYPFFIATGLGKDVWFTELSAARIGKITPSGAISEYAIPSGNTGQDIAAGSSGTIWFTEDGDTIGKVNARTGHITEFRLPAGSEAVGNGVGPDGNMWFTDVGTNSIGKITATGIVTEYPLPTADAQPTDIVTGPDGNLWFTEYQATKIGKITTAGAVTEYPSGGDQAYFSIAAGPDNDLYVVARSGIVRITTAGVTTYYAGEQNASYDDIVLGPDKQMWMTSDPGYLQKFNPKRSTFSNAIPFGSIVGLTVGDDGDVWIANTFGNSIMVYEEKITTIGIRLNGELSFTDPNYGFELGYAVGTASTQTQTISLGMGESVQFKNVDSEHHSAAFLGDATANSAQWPGAFNGSTTQSPAGTAIGTAGWATGSLNPKATSPIYETGLPGFYMIGCQYHYNTNEMRTVVVVH